MKAIDQRGRDLWRGLSLDQKRKMLEIIERLLEAQQRTARG